MKGQFIIRVPSGPRETLGLPRFPPRKGLLKCVGVIISRSARPPGRPARTASQDSQNSQPEQPEQPASQPIGAGAGDLRSDTHHGADSIEVFGAGGRGGRDRRERECVWEGREVGG